MAPAVTTTGSVKIDTNAQIEEAVVVEAAAEEKPKAKRATKKKTEEKE